MRGAVSPRMVSPCSVVHFHPDDVVPIDKVSNNMPVVAVLVGGTISKYAWLDDIWLI